MDPFRRNAWQLMAGGTEEESGSKENCPAGIYFNPYLETTDEQAYAARYLDELVTDMRELNEIQMKCPGLFLHAHILLTAEMDRVWNFVCSNSAQFCDQMNFPENEYEPEAAEILEERSVTLQEKITFTKQQADNYMQTISHLNCASLKRLERETDCHILTRGEGSLLDPRLESRLRNYAGWEHLSEPLHLLVQANDVTISLCTTKLANGVRRLKQYLTTIRSSNGYRRNQKQRQF